MPRTGTHNVPLSARLWTCSAHLRFSCMPSNCRSVWKFQAPCLELSAAVSPVSRPSCILSWPEQALYGTSMKNVLCLQTFKRWRAEVEICFILWWYFAKKHVLPNKNYTLPPYHLPCHCIICPFLPGLRAVATRGLCRSAAAPKRKRPVELATEMSFCTRPGWTMSWSLGVAFLARSYPQVAQIQEC